MFLNDQETATDLLHYEAIAKTVVRLIRDTPKTPLTVGVHGDWGAGKSSVLKMTEDALSKQPKVQCLWFNGWAFEGFEDAKTVIIETIIEELNAVQGKPVDLKGYYFMDDNIVKQVMRPSKTFNEALAAL